ncbi:MAG TPA: hypothetical protein VF250_12035, partial [Conexibacter sp.]
ERRPVRVTSTQRAGATLAVTVRNVRGYPAPVVVSAGTEARRATLVPPGGTRRVVLHARGGRLGAPRLTLARS